MLGGVEIAVREQPVAVTTSGGRRLQRRHLLGRRGGIVPMSPVMR